MKIDIFVCLLATAIISMNVATELSLNINQKERSVHYVDSVLLESFEHLKEYEQGSYVLQKWRQHLAPSNIKKLDFSLIDVKHSLTAKHFHFAQKVNDIVVWPAGLVVSVNYSNDSIFRWYNATVSSDKLLVDPPQQAPSTIESLLPSWNHLAPQGDLLLTPATELVYTPHGNRLRLATLNTLKITKPYGHWRQLVALDNKEVLFSERLDTPAKKATKLQNTKPYVRTTETSPALTLAEALKQLHARQRKNFASRTANQNSYADISARLFDPDPRTTLNDATLNHSSPDNAFSDAFLVRTLIDLSDNNGILSLNGPYVELSDFEPPSNQPTESSGETIEGSRGSDALLDTMIYFHIDQNQRYLQSLGFEGEKAILDSPIIADSNALDGEDNSFYDPIAHRLGFGRGGVPDAEDADVIIHEYAHAIHYDINPNWGGADTGAIGEGFGDYWAASYSFGTPNGQSFNPEWVFTWDGHNEFWPGRRLDQVDFQYDPTRFYSAHDEVDNIVDYADMLWSTPLFQALIELDGLGITQQEVDQIIIESQFGLDWGLSMPELAEAIVTAAFTLYPSGPHAEVFYKWFENMNIISSRPIRTRPIVIEQAGTNGFADPGETVLFVVPIENQSGVTISALNGRVINTDLTVTLNQTEASYPSINPQQTVVADSPFELTLNSSVACGSFVNFRFDAEYQLPFDDRSRVDEFEVTLYTGYREALSQSNMTAIAIPDTNETVTSTIMVSGAGTYIDDQFSIDIDLTHTFRGDLDIRLRSPMGTEIQLVSPNDNTGEDNLMANFPFDVSPVDPFSVFNGEDLNGEWTLSITDVANIDSGELNSWQINYSAPAICDDLLPQPESPEEDEDDANEQILYLLASLILIGNGAGSISIVLIALILLGRLRSKAE